MSRSPRHLLPLHKTLADHLVDRRLDEARGDRLAMTVAVRVVRDKARVVLEVTDELLQFNQPSCRLLCPASGYIRRRIGAGVRRSSPWRAASHDAAARWCSARESEVAARPAG